MAYQLQKFPQQSTPFDHARTLQSFHRQPWAPTAGWQRPFSRTRCARVVNQNSRSMLGWSWIFIYGGFLKWGYPNSWMVCSGTILLTWMTWGYLHFRNPPFVFICNVNVITSQKRWHDIPLFQNIYNIYYIHCINIPLWYGEKGHPVIHPSSARYMMQPSINGWWPSPYQRDMTPVLMLVHLTRTSTTLWWTNILQWKITIFNGKIHEINGHFPLLC